MLEDALSPHPAEPTISGVVLDQPLRGSTLTEVIDLTRSSPLDLIRAELLKEQQARRDSPTGLLSSMIESYQDFIRTQQPNSAEGSAESSELPELELSLRDLLRLSWSLHHHHNWPLFDPELAEAWTERRTAWSILRLSRTQAGDPTPFPDLKALNLEDPLHQLMRLEDSGLSGSCSLDKDGWPATLHACARFLEELLSAADRLSADTTDVVFTTNELPGRSWTLRPADQSFPPELELNGWLALDAGEPLLIHPGALKRRTSRARLEALGGADWSTDRIYQDWISAVSRQGHELMTHFVSLLVGVQYARTVSERTGSAS